MVSIREIDNLHASIGKILLDAIPLRGALPISSDEHPIELEVAPSIDFAHRSLWHDLVYASDVFDDLNAFDEGYDRVPMFALERELIRCNTDDEVVALQLGAPEDVQVANMKHVEYSSRVANLAHTLTFPVK